MPDALAHWPWRLIGRVPIAALGYVVGRGYQPPEWMPNFGDLRWC